MTNIKELVMGSGLFSTGFLKLEAGMAARESMQTVYASNIANADTPGYKADERTFADMFAEKEAKLLSGSDMSRTSPFHMNTKSSSAGLGANKSTTQRMDGNTVDTQQQMAALAENQMMHELNMRIIKGRLSGLANVIKEGGR
ncbi:MAG: flagellar basal body rod protein FlgB [Mariprofundaceae bacterium]